MALQLLLTEHRVARFPRDRISDGQAEELYRRFGRYLDIAQPGPATAFNWQIASKGWVGAFASAGLHVIVQPKVPIANLARMLQFYHEIPVDFFDRLTASATLRDLYDQIVRELTRQVVRLVRQGLHHEYRTADLELSVVRGRMDVMRFAVRPIGTTVPCRVSERTANVPENKLLAFTLAHILRSGLCSAEVQSEVRNAYRLLAVDVEHDSHGYHSLRSIPYSRLTERYRTAHSICRLLLNSEAADARQGETEVVPFLVNMPKLFEGIVGKWLKQSLAPEYVVDTQRHRTVGDGTQAVAFYVDIVIRDRRGNALCVIDTKYKDSDMPASQDVAQVGHYALLERCTLAGLVVPTANGSWRGMAGDVETFRSSFDLSADLVRAGDVFATELRTRLEVVARHRAPLALSAETYR